MIDLVRELVEPSRRALLAELKAGPRTVGELVQITGLKQPNVSNHLSRLRSKGILKAAKVGRQVYYSFADPDIARAAISLVSPVEAHEKTLEFGIETTRVFSRSACMGDELACTEMTDSFLRGGGSTLEIYGRLFAESMMMIGQWWSVKAIDEGQEHLASAIIERLMARVLHYTSPPRPGHLKAVLGCSEGNWHAIGLRMISDLMRLSGWRTFYLGASVPTASFLASVKEHGPDAVMISCPIPEFVPGALTLIERLVQMRGDQGFLIGVGGAAILESHRQCSIRGADFWCCDIMEFGEVILPLLDSRSHDELRQLMKERGSDAPPPSA